VLRKFLYLIIALVAVAGFKTFSPQWVKSAKMATADAQISAATENSNAKLPMMIGDSLKIEKMEYNNRVVRISGEILGRVEISLKQKEAFEERLKQQYCGGNMKAFADANVAVAYSIKYWSPSWGYQTWDIGYSADKCA